MSSYGVKSRDYLERAKACRAAGRLDSLFYAAFELRCGIEARLHEYLDGAAKIATVRKGLWQIRSLTREVENVFDRYEKPVVVKLIDPTTKEAVKLEYTPVTPRLKKIGEMLGDYLHRLPTEAIAQANFESKFSALVDEGVHLLESATRGTLLGPPCGTGSDKAQIRLSFEKSSMPAFIKMGESAVIKMRFRLIKKDDKKAWIKPI